MPRETEISLCMLRETEKFLDATFRETGILRRVISSLCMPRETEISLRTQVRFPIEEGLLASAPRSELRQLEATRRDAEGFAGQRRDE